MYARGRRQIRSRKFRRRLRFMNFNRLASRLRSFKIDRRNWPNRRTCDNLRIYDVHVRAIRMEFSARLMTADGTDRPRRSCKLKCRARLHRLPST